MAREVSDPLWIPIRQGCRFDRLSLMLRRGDEYVVVQCKHWNAFQVTHTDVHQLLGIMVNESATGAILVSSGEFTRYARESAAKLGHVWLIDGDELRRMVGPIAESEAPRRAVATSRPTGDSLATVVGERLLSAAEDRIRGRRREGSPYELMLRLFFALIALAVLWAFVQGMLKAVSTALVRPIATKRAPAPELSPGLPKPSVAPYQPHTQATSEPGPLMRERSEAERREAKRQADEAAKVIEASTPEM